MVTARELSQKFREEIVALHRKGYGYKKVSRLLNLPRDTVGSIIRKVLWLHNMVVDKKEAFSSHNMIPEKTGGQEPQAYCQEPEGRLG
jgi:hypothetical protein